MPTPYHHIACCLDPSPGSDRALEEAVRVHEFGPGRLSLVHATRLPWASGFAGGAPNPEDVLDADRTWLAERAERTPDSEFVLLEGSAAPSVCDWAAENGVDLIVAGAHRGLLQRIALGSFAGYLTHHAPCAVMLVRPSVPENA